MKERKKEMAKGSSTKIIVTEKILSTFEGAFIAADGKTIRLPYIEDGEPIEIKVTLTAAKDIEGSGNTSISSPVSKASGFPNPVNKEPIKATEEEKKAVNELAMKLGLF